jgi:uncharacterized Zn-binding protein involved in type VI secretion
MPEAARVGDDHTCPMTNPNGSPHKGGKIMGPGSPNVKIGGKPAALLNGPCICTGPPDTIQKGSATVKINGQAAVRKMDQTAHGGFISEGESTVIIGG